MATDAKTRIRTRIRARLDELGMTARELAVSVGRGDSWISGILGGAQGLPWEDFDAVAHGLKWTPADLVRLDDSELRELRPHEMRLLRHYQTWPEQIQERWIRMLDYFAASAPDPEAAKLLDLWRDLSLPERRRLRYLLTQPLSDILQRIDGRGSDQPGSTGAGAAPSTTDRNHRVQTVPDSRQPNDADPEKG